MKKLAHTLPPKFLPTGGLWGLLPEKTVANKPPQNILIYSARGCDLSALIVRLSEQLLGEGVHHHVPGPGIEGENFSDRGIRRNGSQIGDTANIEGDPSHTRITIEQVIEIRNQRRALAAGGHIRGTEIGDHRNAGARRHRGPFSCLPSDCELSSQEPRRRPLVIERLSVAADQIAVEAQFPLRGNDRFCVQFAQQKIQPRQIRGRKNALGSKCRLGFRLTHRRLGKRPRDGAGEGARNRIGLLRSAVGNRQAQQRSKLFLRSP